MVRIAVNSTDTLWSEVGSRLRGATLKQCQRSNELCATERPDGVILVTNAHSPDKCIDDWLTTGATVLQVMDTGVARQFSERACSKAGEAGLRLVNLDRFLPSRQLIRQQIDSGKLGEPGLIKLHRWRAPSAIDKENVSNLPAEFLCDLDTVLWLMGRSPQVVYAVEGLAGVNGRDQRRTLQVHLGFAGDRMGIVTYSDQLPDGDDYGSLDVIGSAGAAYSDDHSNRQLLFQGNKATAIKSDEGLRPYVALAQCFADALTERRDLREWAGDWNGIGEVVAAVRASLATHQSVVCTSAVCKAGGPQA